MRSLRRRLASWALAMSLVQIAAVFVPVSAACCAGMGADAMSRMRMMAAEHDCCPPGAHPPGQCPFHRTKTQCGDRDCRLTCAGADTTGLVLGSVGTLPVPAIATTVVVAVPHPRGTVIAFLSHEPLPTSPPPKATA